MTFSAIIQSMDYPDNNQLSCVLSMAKSREKRILTKPAYWTLTTSIEQSRGSRYAICDAATRTAFAKQLHAYYANIIVGSPPDISKRSVRG